MRQLRFAVPVLGAFALIALFLMLPEAPSIGCKACSSGNPYTPLIGAGYFSTLIALSLLFPSFPSLYVARGGLTWAVLLALVLTYIHLPGWCALCLVGHACNILMWTIWAMVPAVKSEGGGRRERLYMMLFAPVSVVALFSCLNLTFMAYGFKMSRNVPISGLHLGDKAPIFMTKTIEGGYVINFVSPGCSHCKEQLEVLNTAAEQMDSHRFINVSSVLSDELVQHSPAAEWVEDKEGDLRKLFKVSGYPTLFVVGADGKIVQIISGVPEQLKAYLITSLVK